MNTDKGMNQHIEQEHPDYSEKARMWRRYRDIYAGGEHFRRHAEDIYYSTLLSRRPSRLRRQDRKSVV